VVERRIDVQLYERGVGRFYFVAERPGECIAVTGSAELWCRFRTGRNQYLVIMRLRLLRLDDEPLLFFRDAADPLFSDDLYAGLLDRCLEGQQYRSGLIGERVAATVIFDIEQQPDRLAERSAPK